MGDAGEGLIDADSRIQERMEELQRERATNQRRTAVDPERLRMIESLRLARTELERQLASATHERRHVQLQQALDEIGRRIAKASESGH